MAFRDTNLDDSPKTRVLEIEPKAKCEAVWWGDRRIGYVVKVGKRTVGSATTAYHAWREAEGKLS
jgi:hypothetical protein